MVAQDGPTPHSGDLDAAEQTHGAGSLLARGAKEGLVLCVLPMVEDLCTHCTEDRMPSKPWQRRRWEGRAAVVVGQSSKGRNAQRSQEGWFTLNMCCGGSTRLPHGDAAASLYLPRQIANPATVNDAINVPKSDPAQF